MVMGGKGRGRGGRGRGGGGSPVAFTLPITLPPPCQMYDDGPSLRLLHSEMSRPRHRRLKSISEYPTQTRVYLEYKTRRDERKDLGLAPNKQSGRRARYFPPISTSENVSITVPIPSKKKTKKTGLWATASFEFNIKMNHQNAIAVNPAHDSLSGWY